MLHRQFGIRVGIGVEHRDGHRFDVTQGTQVEIAVRRRLETELRGNERFAAIDEGVVERWSVLTADLDHVAESLARDQGRSRPRPFEQRVGRNGRTVDQDFGRGVDELADAGDHSLTLVLRRGDLGGEHPVPVPRDDVGEGPADVDAQDHARFRS